MASQPTWSDGAAVTKPAYCVRSPAVPGTPPAEPLADQVTDRVAAQAIRGRLASALGRLSRGQRDVLLLTARGLSGQEVAAAIGIPAGTVASRLARARRKVRAELADLNPSEIQGVNQ